MGRRAGGGGGGGGGGVGGGGGGGGAKFKTAARGVGAGAFFGLAVATGRAEFISFLVFVWVEKAKENKIKRPTTMAAAAV